MKNTMNGMVLMLRSLLLGCLSLAGCGPTSGNVPVEIVRFDDEADEFILDTFELKTADNILFGTGLNFDVLGVPRVPALDGTQILSDKTQYPTEESVVEENRRLAGGDAMRPRLYWAGEQWVGQDFDSLQYLTIFANFERGFEFFSQYDQSGATLDKATVGFYGEVTVASLFPMPVLAADNAAYYPPMDGWLIFRSSIQTTGMPFGMNDAVVAHEFSHRFMHHNVFLASPESFDVWRSFNGKGATEGEEAFSVTLFRGIDEGLADVFALGFSGTSSFIERSIDGTGIAALRARDVEGDFADQVTYEHILQGDYPNGLGEACNGSISSSQGFNFYCIGTLFARVAWDTVGGDVETMRESFLPVIAPALMKTSQRIVESSTSEFRFSLPMFFEPIAQELPAELRPRFCTALSEKFWSIISEVPACF